MKDWNTHLKEATGDSSVTSFRRPHIGCLHTYRVDRRSRLCCAPSSSKPLEMADAVTAILERMVPELEELQERGIFTPAEVKSIVRKRSDLEYGLKKRAVTPEDFVRALEYELNLEALRRRRKAQLGLRRVTESDHAGIRRIHFIFDRAVRRFRMDVRWWMQWADFCMRSRSTKAVDRVFGRALMLHSRCDELWLQATAWQFDRMQQYATARALMQRALRANKLSPRLWTSYFQLELVYVMRVLGRRLALGLHELPEGPSSSRLIADEGLLERAAGSAAADAGEASDGDGEPEAADAATAALDSLATDDAELHGGDGGGGDDGLFSAPAFADVPDATPPATAAADAAAAPDPRAAFFKGMVPRIIYDSAVALLPRDLRLRLAMLRACDSFTTLTAGGGAPLPAFPDLAAYIVASIAADFSADPATWELLAGRAFEGVEATAARRAAALAEAGASAGHAGDSELDTVAGRASAAIPASELSDDALFVVDSRTRQREPEPEEALAMGSEAATAERAAAASERPPTACLPSPALGCPEVYAGRAPAQATAAWLRSLATGSVDEAIAAAFVGALGPQPKRLGSTEPMAVTSAAAAAAYVLPALAQPLWRAAAEGGGASSGPTGGSKRKRASAAPSIDAPLLQMGAAAAGGSSAAAAALVVLLVAPARPEPAAAADAELTAWAAAVDGTVLSLVQSALAAAAASAGSGSHARLAVLRMTHMASGVLCRLLRLPLAHSAAAGRRTAGLLRELLALACTALDAAEAAAAPGSSAAAPSESPAAVAAAAETAWLLGACASLGLQAALRLGQLRDGARLALRAAGVAGALQAPVLAVLPAALSFHLRAARAQLEKDGASGDAVAAALSRARGSDDETVCPATTLAALLPTALVQTSVLSAPSALLGAAVAASPRAPHVVEVFLCLLAAAAANEGDAAPALLSPRRSKGAAYPVPAAAWAPVERTSPIFEWALLAGLPKPAETRVRTAYLDAVEWCSVRCGAQGRFEEQWIAFSIAALKRSAVAEVCERVLGAVAAVAAAGPLSPDTGVRCRREFEAAVASHGGTSAKLWAAFVRFERALLQRGGGAAAAAAPGSQRRPVLRDAASVVHERAARVLLPGLAQEAWHALQREL